MAAGRAAAGMERFVSHETRLSSDGQLCCFIIKRLILMGNCPEYDFRTVKSVNHKKQVSYFLK